MIPYIKICPKAHGFSYLWLCLLFSAGGAEENGNGGGAKGNGNGGGAMYAIYIYINLQRS